MVNYYVNAECGRTRGQPRRSKFSDSSTFLKQLLQANSNLILAREDAALAHQTIALHRVSTSDKEKALNQMSQVRIEFTGCFSLQHFVSSQELVARAGQVLDLEAKVGAAESALKEERQQNSAHGFAVSIASRLSSLEESLRGLLINQAAILEHVRRPAPPVQAETGQADQQQRRQQVLALLGLM